jgi:hypothetical protein
MASNDFCPVMLHGEVELKKLSTFNFRNTK